MGKQEINTDNSTLDRLKGLDALTTLIFYLSVLFFIIGFNFSDTPTPFGWYQQFMPNNLPNFQVSDIFFLDSLTGWAVTGNSNPNDTSGYILKTTNGGDNWVLKFTDFRDFSRVKFINNNTGFVSGGYGTGAKLYKSTDGGNNWFALYSPFLISFDDMSVLNNDTIWLVDCNSVEGGVFRTTDSGVSWQQQLALGSQNPSHIYMFNARIGFAAKDNSYIRKTTDGGASWSVIVNGRSFSDMFFVDSLRGWSVRDSVRATTDGGISWSTQQLPHVTGMSGIFPTKFSYVKTDTLWLGGSYIIFPNNQLRGVLFRTTNGGINWLFQIPDTSIHSSDYPLTSFVNHLTGWANSGLVEIHTVTGGDTSFIFGIRQISTDIPSQYKLFQNYPNPFNPVTNIKYNIKRQSSDVKLTVYEILGKEVITLVNEKQNAGTYEVNFDGTSYSSGVYFYSLYADGKLIDTKKMILIK